ncbi:hypothetical protein WMY93_012656 [Mugilogobius chulae]|uniref:c-SKI SMAD4-binding domain-containing protein n=1 Tax=Mugilogobius chulae TaxID=88201 RepID=A0AAW0P1H8_9GOBI
MCPSARLRMRTADEGVISFLVARFWSLASGRILPWSSCGPVTGLRIMEPMARPLVRDSPPLKDSGPPLKPNQVSETSLYGVPIVSLVIDGKERLCLAQISNTLLKNYSYNEIHNRRVALGITCVQCTPVQLELLRRAGAMPISSRRCGMITKREAERLCKSFLGEHSPPKLPENFAFDVSHDCAWGCRGNFIPARYNSSRAKCIKCSLCSMYFSPNKFIFHSHRTPDARYLQPDAANFNSWRRHLRLTDKKPADDVSHAWEDVKAMFNGGSRKRTLPPSPHKPHAASGAEPRPEVPHKSLRCEDEPVSGPGLGQGIGGARTFPVIPVPSKSFSMQLQKLPPPLFPPPYPFPSYGLCPKKSDEPKAVSGLLWPAAKELYPAFPVFWPGAGGLPVPPYLASPHKPSVELEDRDRSPPLSLGPTHEERCSSAHSSCTRTDDERSGDESAHRKMSYVSAFRPVLRDTDSIAKLYGARTGHVSPDFISEGSSLRSVSPRDSEEEDPDVDVDEPQSSTPDRLSPGVEHEPERVHSPAATCTEESACSEEDRLTRTAAHRMRDTQDTPQPEAPKPRGSDPHRPGTQSNSDPHRPGAQTHTDPGLRVTQTRGSEPHRPGAQNHSDPGLRTTQTRAQNHTDPGLRPLRPGLRTTQTRGSDHTDPGLMTTQTRLRTTQTRGSDPHRPGLRTTQTRGSDPHRPGAQTHSDPGTHTFCPPHTSVPVADWTVHAAEKDEAQAFGVKHRSNDVHVPEEHEQRSPGPYESPEAEQVSPTVTVTARTPTHTNMYGALRIDISVRERDLENMAKEELQKQLVEQVELRKKLEREFQHLKGPDEERLSYREEMVQQLQIVREAHDALHHFSCKMLSPRQCSGACTFKPPCCPPEATALTSNQLPDPPTDPLPITNQQSSDLNQLDPPQTPAPDPPQTSAPL